MHGVKRNDHVESENAAAETARQIEEYRRIVKEFTDAVGRGQGILEASERLLSINPEYYTAWNERKRAILRAAAPDAEFIKNELLFNVNAIKANPKSYATWQHRRWFLSRFCSDPGLKAEIVPQELGLLEKLLKIDCRNFHGWNYRIWLAKWAGLSVIDEFDFTTRKIYENFSNYSAWQRRQHLFVDYCKEMGGTVAELLKNEVELCRNAAWTEPADQSVWFHQRWLFFTLPKLIPAAAGLIKKLAQEQLNSVLQLLEEEPEAVHAMSLAVSMGRREFLPKLAAIDSHRTLYWQSKSISKSISTSKQ